MRHSFSLCMLFACLLTLTACNKDPEEKPSGIVGTWQVVKVVTHNEGGGVYKDMTDAYPETYYEFRADGTVTYHYHASSAYKDTFSETGLYSHNEIIKRLTYRFPGDNNETSVDIELDQDNMEWTMVHTTQGIKHYVWTTLARKQ